MLDCHPVCDESVALLDSVVSAAAVLRAGLHERRLGAVLLALRPASSRCVVASCDDSAHLETAQVLARHQL